MSNRGRVGFHMVPTALLQGKVGEISKTAVRRAARRTAARANENVRKSGRVHTGKLSRSFKTRVARSSNPLINKVRIYSTRPYARFQEKGTRAHGPVRAKFLRFQIRGKGPFIFTKWVRGVKPAHFLRNARKALRREDFLP